MTEFYDLRIIHPPTTKWVANGKVALSVFPLVDSTGSKATAEAINFAKTILK